jgi:hypothetical protein
MMWRVTAIVRVLEKLAPLAAAALLMASGGAPPLREGNIWDHQHHQPTEADVRAAEAAAGIKPPSSATKRQVEEEVNKLLRQTSKQDERLEGRE